METNITNNASNNVSNNAKNEGEIKDSLNEGRDKAFMDIDRMINEGLGGGQVTIDNGLIEETTEIVKESKPSGKRSG